MGKDFALAKSNFTNIDDEARDRKIEEYFNTLKDKGWEIGNYEVVYDQIEDDLRIFKIHFEVILPKVINIDDFGRY